MNKWLSSLAASAFLAVVLAAPPLSAQNVYATLHGSVTDPSGAVVGGADVELTNTSTGIVSKTTTDAKGFYVFPQIAPGGPYTVKVAFSGFTPYQASIDHFSVNDNRADDVKLQVGTDTVVEVSAQQNQVEVSDTQLKTTFEGSQIADLPLLGRDVVQLQKVSPGVVESSDRFGTFSTNGSQTAGNSFLLDGADINDAPLQTAGITPNPDAIGEFQIITSTMNPEYARNSGAIVLEQLKTGTNHIHGDAFEFYRDTNLNAKNYFALTTPPIHQNVFGGTIGGPIIKDKLFFFAAYQGIRNTTSATTQTRVFNSMQRAGDFTQDFTTGAAVLSSANTLPFAIGNCRAGETYGQCFDPSQAALPTSVAIAPGQFNPLSTKLLNQYVPQANTSDGAHYDFNAMNKAGADQGIIRVDYHPTSKDTLWASTIFESNPTTTALPFYGATLPGFTEIDASHTKIFNASYTRIINSSTVNEIRANYFRFNYHDVEPQTVVQPNTYGFNITPQSPIASLPTISVAGYFNLGFSPYGPAPRNDQTIVLTDNLSKVIGSHNLRFGFQGHRYTVENPNNDYNNGSYGYYGGGPFSSGDPTLDFALGIPDSYEQSAGGMIDTRAWEYYGFAQDNWKVSNTLTANYGLGYDVETPYENLQYGGEDIICWTNSTYNSNVFSGLPGMKYPGDPGCNSNGGPTAKYDHVAPRAGFAWAPSKGPKFLIGDGSQSFSVRGGFGVYFNRDQEEGALQNEGDPPFGLTSYGAGPSPSFANPWQSVDGSSTIANPFPFTFPSTGSHTNVSGYNQLDLSQVDPRNTVPYVYNFNLNVERSLPGNMVAQIGYVGSMGRHLAMTYEADPITAAGHASCLANPACVSDRAYQHRDYPQDAAQTAVNSAGLPYYLSVGTQATEGSSNYNSFQAQLRKNPTHGISFTLSYTYAHGLDNASGLESSGFNGRGYNYVPGFQYLNYGDSDYDARHRFVAMYVVNIPVGQMLNSHVVSRTLLSGWELSGITTLQTGFPLNFTDTGVYNSLWCDAQSFYSCPDNPEVSTYRPTTKFQAKNNGNFYYINPAQFSAEPIGTFGNVKRGFLHGPGFNYTNADLNKNFYLSSDRTYYFQFRLEAYNVFNHANFAAPDTNLSDGPSFGQITSVQQPGINGDPQPARSLQLGGKFYF